MRPYEVELTRCTTLCLYVRHCSTKSTITSCRRPWKYNTRNVTFNRISSVVDKSLNNGNILLDEVDCIDHAMPFNMVKALSLKNILYSITSKFESLDWKTYFFITRVQCIEHFSKNIHNTTSILNFWQTGNRKSNQNKSRLHYWRQSVPCSIILSSSK